MYSKILVFCNSTLLNTTPRSDFLAARSAMRSIMAVIRSCAGDRDEEPHGLCYDQQQVEAMTLLVDIPDKTPCALS